MAKIFLKTNIIIQNKENPLFFDLFQNMSTTIKFSKKDIYLLLSSLIILMDKYSRENSLSFNLSIKYNGEDFNILFDSGLSRKNNFSILKKYSPRFSDLYISLISFSEFKNNEVFYSSNYPEERKGYEIVSLSEDIYKYIKLSGPISLGSHLTHYLKWNLNEDISIRYFYKFEDSPEKEDKFFIKSHSEKMYVDISKTQAQVLIDKFNCGEPIEILGKLIGNQYFKSKLKFEED
jgi:hypothetical protein